MFYKETNFKETPIGRVPESWEVHRLADIAMVKGGKRMPKGEKFVGSKTSFPYIRIVDFRNSSVDLSNIKYVSSETHEKIKRYTISSEDVYASIAGTIGLVGLIPPVLNGANLTENAVKLCNLKGIKKEFLVYVFKSEMLESQIKALTGKGTQPKLAIFRIEKLQLPLPPFPEQERISEVLSVVDLAIQKTDEVIAKTERLKKGLMQQLLTKGIGHKEFKYTKELGHVTPQEWQVGKLEEYAYIKGRIGWRGLKASEYTKKGPYLVANKHIINNKIAWETCDHLSEFRYEESPEIQLKANDVIISKDGTIGEAAIIEHLPDKTTINSTMMLVRITSESVAPRFLFYLFQGSSFRRFIGQKTSGTSIPHLFQRDMKNLNIPIPPLQEQRQIINILSVVDKKSELERKEKEKLERIKQGLMDLLLTGKIRVKVN